MERLDSNPEGSRPGQAGPAVNPWLVAAASHSPDSSPVNGAPSSPENDAPDVPSRPLARGGRPRAKDPRNRGVTVALTEVEHLAWRAACEREGSRQVARWVRDLVNNHIAGRPETAPVSVHPEAAEARKQLVGIGRNLNQITRSINAREDRMLEGETVDNIALIREDIARLRAVLVGDESS